MRRLRDQQWVSLKALRATEDPKTICTLESVPRLARDESYAKDLLEAWNKDYHGSLGAEASSSTTKQEEQASKNISVLSSSSTSPATDFQLLTEVVSCRNQENSYGCEFPYTGSEGQEYSGYLVVPQHLHECNFDVEQKIPVVIMFHTGAGPQDIFNRYQADKLAREQIWGKKNGCIVFIADIIEDPVGWSWGNRPRYWEKRKELLSVEERSGVKKRYKLQATLAPILEAVRSIDQADSSKIAAIGFCLGGQPILELGRMQCDDILGLITFHGIFDGINTEKEDNEASRTLSSSWTNKPREVLICNGKGDPYVPDNDLQTARKTFENYAFNVNVLNFEHVLHNFSNPRTKYDDPDTFGYDEHADKVSWNATLRVLQKIFNLEAQKT